MSAAEMTATTVGGTIGGTSSISGPGLTWGLYSIDTTTTLDTIKLPEFESISHIESRVTATGVDNLCYLNAFNKIASTSVLASVVFVIGTPATEED